MASVYTNDLRLEEIGSGEQSGTWGDTTNTNLELIAEAFAFGTEAITTNADTHATTIADGATDPGRAMFLKYTGTLDSACTITIGPNTVSKLWFIENGTSGSQNIIIKQGSGATITIPPGDTKAIYSNGAGSGGAMVDAFASLSVVDLNVSGNLDVDGTANLDVVDIDGAVNMATTALVTGVLTTTAATVFNGGFAANDGSTISTADNTAQLTLISTDADNQVGPLMQFYRNSGSPANNDALGRLIFQGENDAGETIDYTTVLNSATAVGDGAESGAFLIQQVLAGSQHTPFIMNSTGFVFNEDSKDYDFRVESDNLEYALFVQGSDGNVGVNVAVPAAPLTIKSNGNARSLRIIGRNDDISELDFMEADDSTQIARLQARATFFSVGTLANIPLVLRSNNTDRVTVAAGGDMFVVSDVYVGTTDGNPTGNHVPGALISAGGQVNVHRDGGNPLRVGQSANGNLTEFYKQGALVGVVGTRAGDLSIGTGDVGLEFHDGDDSIYPMNMANLTLRDNTINLGSSDYRFSTAFITNGVTTGSDRNEKQDLAKLTTTEMLVAARISKTFHTYRWKDSVVEKGDDARIHTGTIAQELQAAFAAEGLDAGRYGMFMSDTWWWHGVDVAAVEAADAADAVYREVTDSDGIVTNELVTSAKDAVESKDAYTRTDHYKIESEAPVGSTKKTRLGIRYPELLSFLAAYNEQRFAAIETRLTALENA